MSDESAATNVVSIARDYYDSVDADEFYYRVWGGEDIHIGLYDHTADIGEASHLTVQTMAQKLSLKRTDSVLDIGAGYGGSARYLAKTHGCRVTCLNLSSVQNKRNRETNREQGLDAQIDVVDGDFENLPFEASTFDHVWSQDAILHSGNRKRVFEEVDRVLKPGGSLIFTDPMQTHGADTAALKPVLDRIHLASLGSVEAYQAYAAELGWACVTVEEHPKQLVNHYSAVLQNLSDRTEELNRFVSTAYIDNMKRGLQHWIDAGNRGLLNWGFLVLQKKPS